MATLQEMRERNRTRLLQALRRLGEGDRATLASVTGLSRATVSGLVGEAVAMGLMVEDRTPGAGRPRRGGRPGMLRLDPRAGVVVGVDLGHTHVRVVAADLAATVAGERRLALDVDAAPGPALDAAAAVVGDVLASAGIGSERLLGAGLGVARPLDRTTGAVTSARRRGAWAGIRPADELAGRLGVPVRVENDANLGVLGEQFRGAARGATDVIYLKLSTGVGAGLLLDGALYVGARGVAGEVGHVTAVPTGDICRCGNRGCLETVASAGAVARALAGGHGDGLTLPQLFEIVDRDPAAERALRGVGRHVGGAVAPLCMALDVGLVVVGGELGAASRALASALRGELRRRCVPTKPVAVRMAELGDRAEAFGAVALALGQERWLRDAGAVALDGAARARPAPAVAEEAGGQRMGAPRELRAGNVAAVVQALRHHGVISRTDLAQATGLSRTTVLSILEDLQGAGFVAVRATDGAGERRLGRPAVRLALQPSAGVAVGIFAGHEHLHVAVADLSLRLLAERRAALEGPGGSLPGLATEVAGAALEEAGVSPRTVVGAALAVPGVVDPDTGEVRPPATGGWPVREAQQRLSDHFGVPVMIENDAGADALAELALGAGRGLRHVLYVRAGWGVGGALVLDGRLRRGRAGAAGEIAHIGVLGPGGPACQCGRRGCLRTVASGAAILDALAIAHGGDLDLRGLVALARAGDPPARRALSDAGDAIGTAVAALCTTTNPQAVIIGGELGFAGSPLVDAARDRIERGVHPTIGPVGIRAAALGALAGALGAASVVVHSGDRFGHRVAVA